MTRNITAFISGHTDLTKEEFQTHYVPLLDDAVNKNYDFVTAAAFGADRMAIDYLIQERKVSPNKITVYLHERYADRLLFYRNSGFKVKMGFSSHVDRDTAMTNDSNLDIAWLRTDEEAKERYGSQWLKGDKSSTERNLQRRNVRLFSP